MPAGRTRVLYLTYDGIMEPLGQSQVLPYLQRLAHDHTITLVSYEKPEDWEDKTARQTVEAEVRKAGIEWVPLRYHRHPTSLATSYDLAVGLIVTMYLALRRRIQLVHVRSYVPAVLALALKKTLKTRFIFDMRAFFADQRVECGAWRRDSLLYRAAKWFERRFLTSADVVVSLTHAGVSAMREFDYLRDNPPRFEVITTCTDLELFHPADAGSCQRNESERPFTLGFVGSLGPSYMFDLVIDCFKILREHRPDARFLIINQQMHAHIRNQLEAAGVPQDCVEIKAQGYHGVAQEIRKMDAGMFFLKPFPSFRAVAPTKLGEFLASGVPCLSNAGIGDLEEILEGGSVGVILRRHDRQGQEDAVGRLLELAANPETRQRCVDTARRYFSLEAAVQAYNRLYRSLTGCTEPEPSRGGA